MRLMVDCWHLVGGQLPHVCVCLRLRAKANGNLPSNGLVSFVYSKDDQCPGQVWFSAVIQQSLRSLLVVTWRRQTSQPQPA